MIILIVIVCSQEYRNNDAFIKHSTPTGDYRCFLYGEYNLTDLAESTDHSFLRQTLNIDPIPMVWFHLFKLLEDLTHIIFTSVNIYFKEKKKRSNV